MTSCRVVTWNLWWRFGDWQRRFEVIAAELAAVAPDVVGLQEVWARGSGADSVNAAGLLARRLGHALGVGALAGAGAVAAQGRRLVARL